MTLLLLILFAAAIAVVAVIVLLLLAAMFEPLPGSEEPGLVLDDYDLP
jgi:hypothetical protein